MTTRKRPPIRPSLGSPLQTQAETRRRRFLYTDVTRAEHEQIREFCAARGISVSQFLADLMLQDALRPRRRRKQRLKLRPEINLTPEELDKLQLLTRLHEKESVGEFIREVLRPYLAIQRVHSPVETTSLRYYLSEDEHQTVIQHVARIGVSARNYAALLAIRALSDENEDIDSGS